MKGLSFTAIDFETANSSRLSACAVGLCMVEDGEIVKKAAYLIKPPESVRHFDYFQTSVHGITEKDVRNSGEFCDIWDEIEPMLKNRVIAAHNLPFDLSVLKKLTGYYSLPEVPSGYLCTLKLSRKAFPMLASHRLDSVCSFLGFPMNGTHHMAGADAEAAARILIHFAKSRSRNNISEISEYVDTTDPVLSGTIFTNVDAEIYREESEYSEILERIRSETREVSGFFIQKLIEKKKEDGEETGKPTVRQLEFMVKLRSETGVPLFRDDIATRNTASDWISKALEEKTKKQSYIQPIHMSVRGENRMTRPSWDEYFMQIAETVSTRSTCLRRSVGAVLVKDRRILSTGYNGAPKGCAHCAETGCLRDILGIPSGERHEICRGSHAEINAIAQAAANGIATDGCWVYCTLAPCPFCAKALINAGCRRVIYKESYADKLGISLLQEAGVEIIEM